MLFITAFTPISLIAFNVYNSVLFTLFYIILTFLFSVIFAIIYKHFVARPTNNLFKIYFFIKNLFVAIIDLYLVYYALGHLLGLNAHKIVFPISICVLVFYMCKKGLEVNARLAELTIFLIVIPAIILIATTISSVKLHYFKVFLSIDNLPNTMNPYFSLLVTSVISSILFLPTDSMFVLGKHVKRPIENAQTCSYNNYISHAFLASFTLAFTLIIAIFSVIAGSGISLKYSVNPLFALAQMNLINSSISGRIDAIVCIFVFSGLIYCVSFHLYIAKYHFLTLVKCNHENRFILPVFLAICFLFVTFTYPKDTKGIMLTNPKMRNLIDTIIIDNNYDISLKSYKDGSVYNTHCKNIDYASDNYFHSLGAYPDFSHTETIIVPDNVFSSTDVLMKLLQDFKLSPSFPETLNVVSDNTSSKAIKLYKIYTNYQ